ncbi:hypothetical protein [Levilactobacillus suantsaii]|uniref:Uncharacterized protein n=1 Tax=Levilactobacillus suantsaii TaxID=2292255 RepID=A0A4Q0VKJ7_9LACO|nr:hypothetical protein [Levilactobacillus suantsaii]QMU08764.1 hypothetical protein H3M12_03645 [Levilactobacillus suantsaii]RXI78935.1 hypothetical protein DXH47_05340 [Levilactobacillus suantsaii]
MKNWQRGVALVLTTISLGGIVSTTASAASWHRGVPKAIRGKYQDRHQTAAQGFPAHLIFKAKTFTWQVSNMPEQRHSKLTYKKLKAHVYRLKGHVAKRGLVLAGSRDYVIYKKGKKLKLTDYGSYRKMGFRDATVAKKVSHFTNDAHR